MLRLNGALVNVIRTNATDVNVSSSDSTTQFKLGVDFELVLRIAINCQKLLNFPLKMQRQSGIAPENDDFVLKMADYFAIRGTAEDTAESL